MNRGDIPLMAKQLNLLAEVFEKRPVSDGAAIVWFDTLKDFPIERVTGYLIGWPKCHSKFPTPNDVWKACNEAGTFEREETARREAAENKREFHPGVGGMQAEAFLKKMRETLGRPRWTPRQHWERVLDTQPEGSIGRTYAAEALVKLGGVSNREPGQDDEEKRDPA